MKRNLATAAVLFLRVLFLCPSVVCVGVRYIIKCVPEYYIIERLSIGPAPFTASLSFPFCFFATPTRLFVHPPMHATAALRIVRRGLATAAAHPPHVASSSAASSTTVSAASAIPLSNVEAQWATLSSSEQAAVHQQLEELQQKDWKTLSLAEKKAGPSPFFAHMAQGKRASPIFFFFWSVWGGFFFFFHSVLCRFWTPRPPRTGQPNWYYRQSRRWSRRPYCQRRVDLRWCPLRRYVPIFPSLFLRAHGNVQPRRHQRRSRRSGKRPRTSVPRSSKSTPLPVRMISPILTV